MCAINCSGGCPQCAPEDHTACGIFKTGCDCGGQLHACPPQFREGYNAALLDISYYTTTVRVDNDGIRK